jgi:adenine/guanine phosphoribosyltransferase-like PRPP-binding protein
MIGTAPNKELVEHFGHPITFPWLPRPDNYGEGVEGKTPHQKMEMVSNALKLDPSKVSDIKGRSVLIIDDNITDAATYLVARRLLYDAGAAEVGIVALTETIRREEDHDWVLR